MLSARFCATLPARPPPRFCQARYLDGAEIGVNLRIDCLSFASTNCVGAAIFFFFVLLGIYESWPPHETHHEGLVLDVLPAKQPIEFFVAVSLGGDFAK